MTEILFRFPPSWPRPVVAVVCMAVLGVLDFAGALAAAEWVARRSPAMMLLGALAFAALFWFYASALQYAELAVVTFGWIVFLQVGLLLVDRYRYRVHLPAGKVAAAVIIVAAQAYLILTPNADTRAGAATAHVVAGEVTAVVPPAVSATGPELRDGQ